MRKSFLNASLALCTVGAAVWAIGLSEDAVSKIVHLPVRLFRWSMITGGLLIGLGLCLLIVFAVYYPVQNIISRVLYGAINSRYVTINARKRDLMGLHDLYTEHFGSDVPSIDLMRSWIARCRTAFVLVHRVTQKSGLTTRQQLVGSFKLLPLTSEAVGALDAGQITGSMFRPDHIARNKRETAAYYIGDLVGAGWFARGMVMAHLNAACIPAVKRGAPLYARPLTRDGLRIMTQYGFLQVSDGESAPEIGRICKLELGKSKPSTSVRRLITSRRRNKGELPANIVETGR